MVLEMASPVRTWKNMTSKILRALAVMVALSALAVWLATGAHRGWSKTSVAIKKTDEVTGITYNDYQKQFVAGVDFLGVALLGAGVLMATSFLLRNKAT